MAGRILITGSAGRIGRMLRAHWRDHEPIGLDRKEAEIVMDLAVNPPELKAHLASIDTVVHLAADANPWSPFASAARNNLHATLAVIEACLEASVTRLIYVSSIWAAAREWNVTERTTWYAASKVAGETLTRAWADETGHPAVCLRPGYFDAEAGRAQDALESLRVDSTALCRHFDEALAWDGPGCVVRYAVGKLDRNTP